MIDIKIMFGYSSFKKTTYEVFNQYVLYVQQMVPIMKYNLKILRIKIDV